MSKWERFFIQLVATLGTALAVAILSAVWGQSFWHWWFTICAIQMSVGLEVDRQLRRLLKGEISG